MKFWILISALLTATPSFACMMCSSKAGDKAGYPSFVPMGPDGKARYYGSRYEKTDEIPMTEEKAEVPSEEKPVEKKKSAGSPAKNSKAKSN